MEYTIKQVSEMLGIPASTLRYYEKEGLISKLERKNSGYRSFSEENINQIRLIDCLKKTGMPIKEIRNYIELVHIGDSTLKQRYEMFIERRKTVEKQMSELNDLLEMINRKCKYYEDKISENKIQK